MNDKSTKALLIEDNEDDALIVREILAGAKGARFDLTWADRLSVGLERLAEGGINVILLDLSLPDSQGLDTCTAIHAQAPDVPIVVLTGREDTGLAVQAVQAGAQDYLVKGQIDNNLLVRAMRYAIERQQLLVELEQKTQELLQASETRFRTIIEKNADGIVIVDGNGLVCFVNPAAESLFGRQAEEFLGESLGLPVVAGETTEIDIIRRGGETATAEMRVVETMWEGESAYLASLHDITERKRAEEQLRYQAALLANVNDAIVASDAQYRLTAWNAAAESLYGWKAEQVLGQLGLDITQTEYPDMDKAEMLRIIAEIDRWRGEVTQARKDGTRIPVEISSMVLRDESGQITGYVSVNRDITERKRAEKKIRELAKFPSENPNPVLRIAKDGTILHVNKAGLPLLNAWGCQVGRPLPDDWRKFSLDVLSSGLRKDTEAEYEDRILSLTFAPVVDAGYVNVYGLDITARKRAEEERLRLFQETQAHAERMVRLASVSEVLNRLFTVREVVAPIGQGALALSGADRAAVYLRHPDDTITCPWSQGLSPAYLEQVTARVLEMPGGRLLESPELVLIPDVEDLPEGAPLRGLARAEGYRAAGLWPLVYEGRVIAAVGCYYDAPRTWSVAGQEVREAFARQAAVALENARLFEAEQTRSQELDALYGLSRQLVATDDMKTVLSTVAHHAVETVHATFCRILILEEDGAFVCRAACPVRVLERDPSVDSGHRLGVRRPEPELAWPAYQQALSQTEPLVLRQGDPALSAEKHQALLLDLAQTLCLVPLRVGGEAIGVLTLGEARSAAREAFDADKLRLVTSIAAMTASAINRAGLFEQLERRVSELAILYEMDRRMAASLHVRDILDFAVQSIPRVIGAEACSLLLWDEWEKALIVRAGEGWPGVGVGKARYRQGEGLVGRVFLERRAANVPDVSADPRWKSKYGEDEKLPSGRARCALAVPLILGEKTLGVLNVVNKIPLPSPVGTEGPGVSAFTEADEAILTSVASQMAVALENARLYEDLRDLSIATIRSLATAIDARDPYTRGHSEGVTRLAVQLARELGWDEADLEMLEFAALLHDVGKIAVPDAILRKPGPLTSEEWDVMHRHPYYSRQIVAPVEPLRRLTPWIYHHHERWDGTGYPDGLKGEAIPLAARIIAVADVWDALRSDRPYRKAWPEKKALEYIREQAGQHFDPQVVEVFLRVSGNETGTAGTGGTGENKDA